MAIFKIQAQRNGSNIKLLEQLNYINKPTSVPVGYTYTAYTSACRPYEEMMLAKECHYSPTNNTLSDRFYFEFILSIPESESDQLQNFSLCVQEVLEFLSNYNYGHYQTICSIHTNTTSHLHAHFILNNIDFINGIRLVITKRHFFNLREAISNILEKYGFSPIIN